MSSNPYIEQMAITKLLTSKNPELLVKINPNTHFANTDLQKLYLLIRNHFVEHGEWITFDHLASKVVSLSTNKDKAMFMASLIEQLKSKDVSSLSEESLVKELDDFSKFRLITDKADRLISAVQAKDIEATLAEVNSMYESVYVNSGINVENADAVSLMGQKVKYSFRQCGIPNLDERGPFIEGGLTIIAGGSGKGKSNLALQFDMYDYFNHPEDSNCYYSYELSKVEIYSRAIAQIAEVDVGHIMSDNLTPEEKIKVRLAELIWHFDIDKANATDFVINTINDETEEFNRVALDTLKRRPNRFYIYDETIPFDDLMLKMKLMRDTKNVRRQTLDYLTLIPTGYQYKGLARWESPIVFSEKLKMFAKEDGKKSWITTPVQFNEKDDELKFSKNIENAVDLYLKFKMTDDDKTLGTVTVDFGKFRTYLTVPNKQLGEFKLLRQFEHSKFKSFDFN